MATCPNKNLDSWKLLATSRGEDVAYYLWDKYDGDVPESESRESIVNSGLKATTILQSPKADQFFASVAKNKISGDFFWKKMQADLGIPKDQMEILKSFNTEDKGELISSLLGNYSYTVEINTAKEKPGTTTKINFDENPFLDPEDFQTDGGGSTKYYSNLTVPGGINYTENEIATPAITPSIKGHAQFATENGIGWFRSDDASFIKQSMSIQNKEKDFEFAGNTYTQEYSLGKGFLHKKNGQLISEEEYRKAKYANPKTRRILEVQSDLFQTGRDKKDLISKKPDGSNDKIEKQSDGTWAVINTQIGIIESGFKTQEEADNWLNPTSKENQFLQLLNQGSNWVTFFVKSILQDSAKKGYEKVLFPSGDTASKVEGHTTLEEFKKEKEDRIKTLEEQYSSIKKVEYENIKESTKQTEEQFEKQKEKDLDNNRKEVEQLKQEIERVDREGFGALKPIYNFYENTVANILNKQYGKENVKKITDEYGNTWNEISIVPEREQQTIMLQKEGTGSLAASKDTIEKVKKVIEKMGISLKSLEDYIKTTGLDVKGVNGLADLTRKIIAIAEGKEAGAITEEMVHVATAILEQKNPQLITQLISKIDRFKIYKQTLVEYETDPDYQLPNGKPDIRKIKKEAVDKLISELIVNKLENINSYPELEELENQNLVQRMWQSILDAIKALYRKADIDLFQEVADTIMEGEVGTLGDNHGMGTFYQKITNAQEIIVANLAQTKNSIEKKIDKVEAPSEIFMDTEEASNYYERTKTDGSKARVKNRVTDRVKAWYEQKFKHKTFTDTENIMNEIKRRFGVKGHADLEEIHNRFYNPDGTKRESPLEQPKESNLNNKELYQLLEDYYVKLIDTFPENTLILAEQIIYDEETDEAGTIDFLAITPEGKATILDWKFMYVNESTRDVPLYKQGAFGIQLNRYKEVLMKKYGVVEVVQKKAIPIAMNIEFIRGKEAKLNGIAIGSVDPTKITNPFLIPVTDDDVSTGFEDLDRLLNKVKALITQVSKEEVTDEEERVSKIDRLNSLRSAVRIVQGTKNLQPLIDVVNSLARDGGRIFNNYTVNYKDRPATSLDSKDKDLSDMSYEMVNFIKVAELFQNLGSDIGHLIYNSQMEQTIETEEDEAEIAKRKRVLETMNDAARDLYTTRLSIVEAHKDFANKHIGERNQTVGLLNPEKVLKGLSSLFRGVSDLPLKSLELLFKITRSAQGKAVADSTNQVKTLMRIREKLMSRGGDVRSLVQKLYQKDDDGKLANKLIQKYDKEFYNEMDEQAASGGSFKWLNDNVDLDAYNKEASQLIKERVARIYQNYGYNPNLNEDNILNDNENIAQGNITEDELDKMYYAIDNVKNEFNINRPSFNGYNNYVLKRHPKEKWLSTEYVNITKDADLLELYNFITEINKTASDTGYISNIVRSTFLPFIRKSMAEQLAMDGPISAIANFTDNFTKSLKIRPDDTGYGMINEVTGELENSIPKYYTNDFTKMPDGVNDYSDVSEDLFRNMILYLQQVNKYKYLSEVEGQLELIKSVEQFKDRHLKTNHLNQVVFDEKGEPVKEKGNAENVKMFDDFLRVVLYDQKYILSDADVPLHVDKILNFVKKVVNSATGKELFKPNENASPTSLIKTIDAMNRGFQLKTLGFEVISGAVNAFGGNVQLAAQSGNYFKAREVISNEAKIVKNSFKKGKEQDIFIELVNTFMPMKDDPAYEELNKAGITKLTRANFGDMLMFFMRYPEQVLEKSIFLTLMDNTIIEDGRMVNVNEFVKAKHKDRYKSASDFKTAGDSIQKEIEELKKRSISKIADIKDGELVIPGLDLSNRTELQRITNLSRRISRNATGGMSDGDVNRMSMSIWTRSMMVFKNWIPKLLDTRFSEFRKVSDDFSVIVDENGISQGQKYDIGRIRLFGRILMDSLTSSQFQIKNIMEVNDKGIEYLDDLLLKFAEEYKKETGEELNIDRDQFFDLIRNNLRRQIQELAILGSLFGAMLALGFVAPDDDDDKATKNFYRFSQKVVDKFTNELLFFYNPIEFEKLLSGGMFPALGVVNDGVRFTKHFLTEVTGRAIDDDKMIEKAQPIKNLMKMFPVTKPAVSYLSVISNQFAEDFDVTIQKENNLR